MRERRWWNGSLVPALLLALGTLGWTTAAVAGVSLLPGVAPLATAPPAPEKSVDGTVEIMVGAGGHVYANSHTLGFWQSLNYPGTELLTCVTASSMQDIWVGGEQGVAHFDGEQWSTVESLGGTVRGLLRLPDGTLFACGDNGLLRQRVGDEWQTVEVPTSATLNAIWGLSVDQLWLAGNSGLILRGGPGGWTQLASGTPQNLNAIWSDGGVGPVFVGTNGVVRVFQNGVIVAQTSNTPQNLNAVHGVAFNQIWAVGNNGHVIRYDGTQWQLQAPGVTNVNLRAVRVTGSGEVIAAGSTRILFTDGPFWNTDLVDPTGASWQAMFALPHDGRNARWWDGFKRTRGVSADLFNPAWVTALTVYDGMLIAGGSFTHAGPVPTGRVAAFDGEAWHALGTYPGTAQVWGAAVIDDLLVVADDSEAFRWNGELWEAMPAYPPGTSFVRSLTTVSLDGQDRLFLTGDIPHPVNDGESTIVEWNRNTDEWIPVGNGIVGNQQFYNVAVFEGDLYISGGSIFAAGRVMKLPGGNVAGVWETVLESTDFFVVAVGVHAGSLYAGCGLAPNIDALLRYQPGGTPEWVPQGALLASSNDYVWRLVSWGDRLLMTGRWGQIGGVRSGAVATWRNGVVSDLGFGTSGEIPSHAMFAGDAYFGGSLARAGGKSSWGIARWRDTGLVATTVTTQLPSSLDPDANLVVNAQVESYHLVHDVILSFRATDAQSFQHRVMSAADKASGAFQVTIPAAQVSPLGLQTVATALTGTASLTAPSAGFTSPAFVGAGVSFAVTQEVANRYELFGIPFAPSGTMAQIFEANLGQYNPANWRLERWNPTTERYLPFPQVPIAAPGRGYYIIQREPRNMVVSGATSSTVGGGTSIVLEPGWNMIATPYLFNIPWAQVSLPAGVEDQLIGRFDDAYDVRTVMEPWRGYFVYNAGAAPATLVIPPVSAKAGDAPALPQELPGCDWLLRITPQQGERRDLVKTVGFLTPGADGPGDLHQPPSLPHDLAVWLEREEGDRVRQLRRDLRPAGDGAVWDLVVRPAGDGGPVSLSFDRIGDVPAGLEVALATPTGVVDLRRAGGAWQGALAGETRLRLIVGDPVLVEQAASTLPQPYALLPAYPNPFNPATTVAFTLPREGRVRLAVYDVAGRRVRTLIDDVLGAGRHDVIWDGLDQAGRSQSSGVYFARLQVDGFEQTRKLTLVR